MTRRDALQFARLDWHSFLCEPMLNLVSESVNGTHVAPSPISICPLVQVARFAAIFLAFLRSLCSDRAIFVRGLPVLRRLGSNPVMLSEARVSAEAPPVNA